MNCLLGVCLGTVMWRPVSIFFGGEEIRANPAYWRSPTDSSQHISTTLFPRKFPPKYTTNKNDLNILELEKSDNQNLFGGKTGVHFVMLLCFCHSVSSSMRSHVNWFSYNSVFMPLHCDSSICLLGPVLEIILKLRGSCHLRVALKHQQSLCFRFQLP